MARTAKLDTPLTSAPTPQLQLFDPQRQRYFPLHKLHHLGSTDDNDISFPEYKYISKTHARIQYHASGQYLIEDLKSTNGTYLNHRPILKTYLTCGDTLTLGNTHLILLPIKNNSSHSPIDQISDQLGILLSCPQRKTAFEQALIFAQTHENICILGETGTGKEMLAQFIHHVRTQNKKPLISVNMSAIPENLIELELFGAKKGSYTGAIQDTPGLMEHAKDGTLFLDEIGDLPLHLQPKLLRALDNREVRRIGETQTRSLKCYFVFATHKDLKAHVSQGTFREDLFHRITVLPIHLPSLRETPNQVVPIAEHMLPKPYFLSTEAKEKLSQLSFPGNIRELKNIITRARVLAGAENRHPLLAKDLIVL